VSYRKSFIRDLKKIQDKKVYDKVQHVLEEIEKANDVQEIKNLSQLSGHRNCYQIRIDEYRLGLIARDNEVEIIRFLHRKDIYRYFP
jgi:mRNA interferase RelE/StbE